MEVVVVVLHSFSFKECRHLYNGFANHSSPTLVLLFVLSPVNYNATLCPPIHQSIHTHSRLFQSQHQLQNHHHHLTTMSAIPNVAKKAIGKLHPDKTAFLLCDIQDRFRPLLYRGETIIQTARYLTSVAKTLDIPIVVTQQYTKVFGPTVQDCFANESNLKSVPIFDKKLFSMLTEDCRDHLSTLQRTSYVLFGIEAHVCVQQTALDLLEDGHDVHIVVDGVTSQQPFDREIALQRLSAAGAFLTTAQSVAFMLMQSECCIVYIHMYIYRMLWNCLGRVCH